MARVIAQVRGSKGFLPISIRTKVGMTGEKSSMAFLISSLFPS